MAQVWNLTNCKLRASLVGHTGYINTVTVSPDGSLCASGGKARRPRPPAPARVKRAVRTNKAVRWQNRSAVASRSCGSTVRWGGCGLP